MTGIVDRIENDIIVVECEEEMYNVPKEKCVTEVHEGDVVDIRIENEEVCSIKRNIRQTKKRKKYIDELIKDMWEK